MPSRPCCMVVEDQALIAMAIEAQLEDAGFEVAGPFDSSAKALLWLEDAMPCVAVLDVMLRDGPCLGLAKALRRRGIPFAVHSGLVVPPDAPPELREAPWIAKPARRGDLVAAIERLMGPGILTGSAAGLPGSAGARRSRATRRSPSRP